MIKIVVAGAENNATFRNLRNEKILTVSKNTHLGVTPACHGFAAVSQREFWQTGASQKSSARSRAFKPDFLSPIFDYFRFE
jgi:hypothetical protein